MVKTNTNRFYTGDPRGWSGMDGVFPLAKLTPLGKKVYEESLQAIGRSPKHRGVSRSGMYLKWLLREGKDGTTDVENLMVFRDWLLDEGIEVALEKQSNTGLVGKRRKSETWDEYHERCPERRRDYIKLTLA